MTPAPSDLTAPVSLDLTNECLWRGAHALPLRPKTFAVLRLLTEHPGQLVSKAALLDTVWPETVVGDGVLMVCIRELRRVLGDDSKAPQFIETVHRRGYRLIGNITVTHQPGHATATGLSPPSVTHGATPAAVQMGQAVGREAELGQLHAWLHQALSGRRQIVFVTGEAGLGKTTLVEAFLDDARGSTSLWMGRGQCIEHYGVGEPYLPVLEAFGRLCQAPGDDELVALLARRAPTWLVQMPWLLSTAEFEAVQRRVLGATRERMLREMAEAIEEMTAAQPLILVFEDLHWSDYSTLDLIARLARRQEPARLLLLGTYRPADVAMGDHPLYRVQQELHMHTLCAELPLTFLTETAIASYLAVRLPGTQFPSELVCVVHQRSEGNPLFMVSLVAYWVTQGWLVAGENGWTLDADLTALQASLPASLRHMLETQLDRLRPAEQRALEVGSIAGVEFSAAAVAAGLEEDVIKIDERCAAILRRSGLLQSCGEQTWSDGTVAGCYGFVHALYQEVLYSRLTAARRVYLHRQIGMRLEAGYLTRTGDIAAELARHFEQGRDVRRSVMYRRQAAGQALHKHANREAIDHLTKALEQLQAFPATLDRNRQELDLLLVLGPALMATKGFSAPEVEDNYIRARELGQQLEESPQLFSALRGLWHYYFVRARLRTARALGEQLYSLAQHLTEPILLMEAHRVLGATLFFLNELVLALSHLEHGLALYDPLQHCDLAFHYGTDPGVACLSFAAWTRWLLGYPDQALCSIQDALTLAHEIGHPLSMAHVLSFAAIVSQLCGDTQGGYERTEALIALSAEQGLPFRMAMGVILRGWALTEQGWEEEGIAQMCQGLAAYHATGAELDRPFFLGLIARAYGKGGQIEVGLHLLDEALTVMRETEQYVYETELYRLRSDLLGLGWPEKEAEAETRLRQAFDIARCQQAKSLELRAATSLARLWQSQGKRQEAYDLLAPVYNWFTEGFDTADLKDAKTLLDKLNADSTLPKT